MQSRTMFGKTPVTGAIHVPHQDEWIGKNPNSGGLKQPGGSPVRGTPIHPDDPMIGHHIYHVTTNLPAVKQSGHLRAGGVGGLGGDDKDKIVSMTTDPKIAHGLEHDIKFMAGMHKKHGPDPEIDFNHETKEWEGGDVERSHRIHADFAAEAKKSGFEHADLHPHQHATYGLGDHATNFYSARDWKTGQKNPLFFGDGLKHVNPDHVGTVHIPKQNLKDSGAMITDLDHGNKFGLSEVRADVPLHGAEYHQEGKKLASKESMTDPVLPMAHKHYLASGGDEWLFEAAVEKSNVTDNATADPDDPGEDPEDDTLNQVGTPQPSQHWWDTHSSGAQNPADTGPADFGKTLNPDYFSDTMGMAGSSPGGSGVGNNPDDKLLAPGPAVTSTGLGYENGNGWSGLTGKINSEAYINPAEPLKPAWLAPAASQGSGVSTGQGISNSDIAKAARAHLASKVFTHDEQQEIIKEAEEDNTPAANYHRLILKGSQYESLERELAALESQDQDESWLW